MQTTGYTTLTRMSGLMREMSVIANNVANAPTTGFRQQGMLFSEYIARTEQGSVSMAAGRIAQVSTVQGTLLQTKDPFDLAIEGEGYFQIQTPEGVRLTRNGVFAPGPAGDLLNPDGYPLLDAGGAPVFVPPGRTDIAVAADGTLSSDGQPFGQIGLVSPSNPRTLVREGTTLFRSDDGIEPVLEPRIRQGFVEQSNVDTLGQIARMIEVQRAYQLGQSFLDQDNERLKTAVKSLFT